MKIVECIPNFSEGRDACVVRAIADCFVAPNVKLLHVTSDVDHNRSVVTAAGEADAVADALVRAVGVAAERIDMRCHEGAHPCIGAADVLPLVPLRGTDMTETAALAADVGRRIAQCFGIPVWLYEASATRSRFRNLARVRKGGFSALSARLAEEEEAADFGPRQPHASAGAVAVGARKFLIAYNVDLATDDVRVARAIAGRIRERDGGLPGVKALGLSLPERGLAQVSMNLTDYEKTSPVQAYDAVCACAREYGVPLAGGELIGLVPEAAVKGVDGARLGLKTDLGTRIIERLLPEEWLL